MYTIDTLKQAVLSDQFDQTLNLLYPNAVPATKQRYADTIDDFVKTFGNTADDDKMALFSSPGRTEVGGNHTDHQHGAVLAAAVNMDVIAVVRLNDTGVIRVQSKGFRMDTIDLSDLSPQENERTHAASLIRGIAFRLNELGYRIGGFDAYTTSNVLKGSGLSSSAAFENLIGTILNYSYNDGDIDAVEIAKVSQFAEVHYFGKACGLMDQMASSVGGFASMDFGNPEVPIIRKIDFDFAHSGYALCIVDTKGNHADLTPDYDAIPFEMKSVAAYFGKDVLRDVDPSAFYQNLAAVRETVSDRAVIRAIHFFNENQTALDEAVALEQGDFDRFKGLVKASGLSSFCYLQNVFSPAHPAEQGVSLALAVSQSVLGDEGVCRVHGGGFAGTIQAFVPLSLVDNYRAALEAVFGEGTCHVLSIRPIGSTRISD